jgi:hypothetical protein
MFRSVFLDVHHAFRFPSIPFLTPFLFTPYSFHSFLALGAFFLLPHFEPCSDSFYAVLVY